MRTTLTLTVDNALAEFIHALPGFIDPSALMNRLLREDMARCGMQPDATLTARLENDDVMTLAEFALDEDTHAAE
jgi:hypothetical protein